LDCAGSKSTSDHQISSSEPELDTAQPKLVSPITGLYQILNILENVEISFPILSIKLLKEKQSVIIIQSVKIGNDFYKTYSNFRKIQICQKTDENK
jgi:hypothetical protein